MLKKILSSGLAKFLIVGVSNAAIGYIVFFSFYNFIFSGAVFYSQCVSYGSGIFWSFFWNRKWTFSKKTHHWNTLFPFIILQVSLLILSASLMKIAANILNWDINIIWLLIMTFITVINFVFSKFFVFRT